MVVVVVSVVVVVVVLVVVEVVEGTVVVVDVLVVVEVVTSGNSGSGMRLMFRTSVVFNLYVLSGMNLSSRMCEFT